MDSNVDNVDANLASTKARQKTVWDHNTHMVFVELCLDEVRNGNRPGSHFNKVGWTNIGKNLKEKTGNDYKRIQLKNHWDAMKRDWKIYDRLMRIESGLGWDSVKKTIDVMPDWWDEKIKADPEIAEFRGKNLEMYHDYYGALFRDCVAVGDKTMTRAQFQNTNTPCDDSVPKTPVDLEGKGDSDDLNSEDVEEIQFPESSSTKRKKSQNTSRSSKGKSSEASTFESKLDTVLQVLTSRSTQMFPQRCKCLLFRIAWTLLSSLQNSSQVQMPIIRHYVFSLTRTYGRHLCIYLQTTIR